MSWLTNHPLGVPLQAVGLLIIAGLFGGLVVHLWRTAWRYWAVFLDAVALYVYLHRPWRCAWDKARRRAP